MNNALNVHKLEEASYALKAILQDLDHKFQLRLQNQVSYQLIYFESLLDQVSQNFERFTRNGQMEILYDFESCKQILFPYAHLESIFHKLISHAIRYCYPGKKPVIKISSNYHQGSIWLSFQDNSIGVDLHKYAAAPFSWGEPKTPIHLNLQEGRLKTVNPGEALGGSIYLESKIGEGTIFVIEFDKQPPAKKLD